MGQDHGTGVIKIGNNWKMCEYPIKPNKPSRFNIEFLVCVD